MELRTDCPVMMINHRGVENGMSCTSFLIRCPVMLTVVGGGVGICCDVPARDIISSLSALQEHDACIELLL